MARLFDNASSQYLSVSGSCGLTSGPFSFAAWFYPDEYAASVIMSLEGHPLYNQNSLYQTSANPFKVGVYYLGEGGTGRDVQTPNTGTTNAWHHAVGCFSTASRDVYLDGGTAGQDSTSDAPNPDFGTPTTDIGRRNDGDPLYFSGRIAEVGIWNVVLDATDITNLYTNKYCPLLVKPGNLVAYWKLAGTASPEPDDKNDYDLTLYNSPTQADHPPGIVYSLGVPKIWLF